MTKKANKPSSTYELFKFTFKTKCYILIGLVFVLYANTLLNEYALDDEIVIQQNDYVHKGFSGIGKILTCDAFDSYNRVNHAQETGLSGGRYRPLSIIVFAIEQQIFGDSTFFRHLINVVFYALCVIAIFYFLQNYFFIKIPFGNDCAFFASVLFAIHPIHTEAVANIKSLDEILSLLFIVGTFIYSLEYCNTRRRKYLIMGMSSFLLALLSKEYAIMLIFLLPILFYLFNEADIKKALVFTLPYYGIFVVYILLRVSATGIPHYVPSNDILMNPYLFATSSQKGATEIFILGKYFIKLLFPYPLSADYSYQQIPYQDFSSIGVWMTILFYTGIILWGVQLFARKNILAFPVFFYLVNLILISNFIMDIGATMGERLIFHSSFAFVVILSYGVFLFSNKLKLIHKNGFIKGILSIMILLCATEVISRNKEWKNDMTLFNADIHSAPNSFMINNNVGANYINLAQLPENVNNQSALIDSAMKYLRISIVLHRTPYVNSYLDMGICYFLKGMSDSSLYYCKAAKQINSTYPELNNFMPLLAKQYINNGLQLAFNGKTEDGISKLKKALSADTNNVSAWYNLGGAYFSIKQWDSARYYWTRTLQLDPGNSDARRGMSALPKVSN